MSEGHSEGRWLGFLCSDKDYHYPPPFLVSEVKSVVYRAGHDLETVQVKRHFLRCGIPLKEAETLNSQKLK